MFTPSGCKDINIRKVLFVNKTHILIYNSTIKELQVFATNSNCLIHISLQPDGVNLRYFKLSLLHLTESKC